VWAEKLRGLLLGTELVGHKFLVEQPQPAAFRRCERPAVEEEHERVVPGSVWRHPVDTQQPPDPQGQAELLSNLALSGLEGWLVGLGHPTWEIPIRLVAGIHEQDAL
jgi:hypothetical protein